MPEPLAVDIVVTSYDYARFLPAAIDSALAQDHPRVRVIVVDDGSRDGSPQIIAGYGGLVHPILKANGGQASAFNAALEACQGDVVLRRSGGPHPAVRHVALRAGRRSVIFRGPPPARPCPRAHPLRSQNGCYRVALRGRKRLRRYISGRTVVLR